MRGEPLEGECTCIINPPCSFCERVCYVILRKNCDDFWTGSIYSKDFEDAEQYPTEQEAKDDPNFEASVDYVVAYDRGNG